MIFTYIYSSSFTYHGREIVILIKELYHLMYLPNRLIFKMMLFTWRGGLMICTCDVSEKYLIKRPSSGTQCKRYWHEQIETSFGTSESTGREVR
jgi:hypothetical protein